MRKLIAIAAAGLMIAGGALVSAPAASAYPVGQAPVVGFSGPSTVAPRTLKVARVKNYTPRCRATLVVSRVSTKRVYVQRTRTVSSTGTASIAFRSPGRVGRFVVTVKQVKAPGCAGFSDSTTLRVR